MVLYVVSLKYAHAIGPVTKNMVIHEAEKCAVMYDVAAQWLGLDVGKFKLVCVHNFDSPGTVKLNYFNLSPEIRISDYIPAAGSPNVMAIVVPKPSDTEEIADELAATPQIDPTSGKSVSRVRAAKESVARVLLRMWPERAALKECKLAAQGYSRV